MRLIDADRLKEFIDDDRTVLPELIQYNRTEVLRMIEQGRILGAKPVRYGHWDWVWLNDADAFRCSSCGRVSLLDSKFCQHCGARMDEVI